MRAFIERKRFDMEPHCKAFRGILIGSGVVHTTKQPLIHPDYPPERPYRNVVIRADRENAGVLHVYGDGGGEGVSLLPNQEAQIEVSSLHSIYVRGETEETKYDWTAV
jgi:hypothetical protein